MVDKLYMYGGQVIIKWWTNYHKMVDKLYTMKKNYYFCMYEGYETDIIGNVG